MFFVPAWITNFILLGTCWLSGFQLVQMRRPNPVLTLQFIMVLFCLVLVVTVAITNRMNPLWSMGFFAIAVINLFIMIRQNRLLPPRKKFE